MTDNDISRYQMTDYTIDPGATIDRLIAERDAALSSLDSADASAQTLHEVIARLQQRLTAADERADVLEGLLLKATPSKVQKCRACGGTSLTWFAQNTVKNGIQQNRLNTNDVTCMFVLGCDDCSETLALVSADKIADCLPVAALKPAEGGGDEA